MGGLAPGVCLPVASCAWAWFSSPAFAALAFMGGDGDEVTDIVSLASGDFSIASSPTRSAAVGDTILRVGLLGVTAATRGGVGS